jgi:TRAP-type transport system periplasmic protein
MKQAVCYAIALVILLGTTVAHAKEITLKIATLSPEGSMWMEKMRAGASEVARKTRGRVTFKFYPGGVMGNDTAVLRKIRVGQLHGGAVVGGALSDYFPANQIYAQPMKFFSLAQMDHVRRHMDRFIQDGLYDAGFVTFGLSGGGFAYIMSKHPVETVADLRKQKVWIPDNDNISREIMAVFGISPIPLPLADVRTALQSGLIDTVATSAVAAVILQWHTQIRYVTDIPLIYLYGVLAVDKKQFLKIAEPDRTVVKQIMTQAFEEIDRQNREDDVKAIAALKNQEIQFITPSGPVLDEWRTTADRATDKMVATGMLPADVVAKIDELLKAFHE